MKIKSLLLIGIGLIWLASCGNNRDAESAPSSDSGVFWIGQDWSRQFVTQEYFNQQPSSIQKLILHTAKIDTRKGHGTGIYLGRGLMLTNSHVVRGRECRNLTIQIWNQSESVSCRKILWSDRDVDAAIIEIDDQSLYHLEGYRLNNRRNLPRFTERVATAGFGTTLNPNLSMTIDSSSECTVVSNNEMRFMPPPGTSPGLAYNVWAIPLTCDTSPGDSGAAVIDRDSGELVGLIFGGRLRKNHQINIGSINYQDAMIWDQLSYAIPIREIMKRFMVDRRF